MVCATPALRVLVGGANVYHDSCQPRALDILVCTTYPLFDRTVEGKTRGATAEPCIHFSSATTTLLNAPDDERLTTAAITSSEDTLNTHRIFLMKNSLEEQLYYIAKLLTFGGVWMLLRASCLRPIDLRSSASGPKKPSARKTS